MRMISLLSVLLILSLFQCEKQNNAPPSRGEEVRLNCDNQPALCQINKAYQGFGFDLFRQLSSETPEENIFISPASIATALSMTMNGAAGKTREDMQETLGGIPLGEVNAANKALLEALPKMDASVNATMANSIWYREGLPIQGEFLATNEEYYNGEIRPLDFSVPQAKDIINSWVQDQTEGKIEEIISRIESEDVMYLINAIYFQGDWQAPFNEDQTAPAPFHLTDGSSTQVEMMRLDTRSLPYFDAGRAHLIDLAYGDGEAFSMAILLPKKDVTVTEVLGNLNSQDWQDWTNKLTKTEMEFGMPKFEMSYQKRLNDPLKEMGMQRAFEEEEADFSNISTARQLFINAVQHKAFVKVNESGTEAAATTSVGVGTTSAAGGPIRITVDRPFLFLIHERQTGNLLFLGKMMNPANQ